MLKKIISATGIYPTEKEDTRARIIKGAKLVADIVGKTLGPYGRNAFINKKYKSPPITNDGVTIARHLTFHTSRGMEVEDLGAQGVVEACMRTDELAGDSTTTTAVFVGAILDAVKKRVGNTLIASSSAYVKVAREIQEEAKNAIAKITEKARPLSAGDLQNVAITSLGNEEYGKLVADMVEKTGKDGYIAVEDNWLTKHQIDSELIIGMKKLGNYASPYFCNDKKQKEAVWENTRVLVCNEPIESSQSLQRLFAEILKDKEKRLVIFNGSESTEAFTKPFIVSCLNTISAVQGGQTALPYILLVKVPSLTSEELEDLAVFCNAKFIDRRKEMKLTDVSILGQPSDLGFAAKVVVTDREFIVTGGAGDAKTRIKVLAEQMEHEEDPMFRNKVKQRIANLSSGIGIIRVGAPTEQERTYLKDKITDAKNAAKSALEEGVLRGGGVALCEIAEELGNASILYEPLKAPYAKIQENAGEELVIADTVLDAAKGLRLAMLHAASVSAKLITTEIAITDTPKSVLEELQHRVFPVDEENSFRDDKNLDIQAQI